MMVLSEAEPRTLTAARPLTSEAMRSPPSRPPPPPGRRPPSFHLHSIRGRPCGPWTNCLVVCCWSSTSSPARCRLVLMVACLAPPLLARRTSRPRRALRGPGPRLLPSRSACLTEIDSVCLSSLPLALASHQAPILAPATLLCRQPCPTGPAQFFSVIGKVLKLSAST